MLSLKLMNMKPGILNNKRKFYATQITAFCLLGLLLCGCKKYADDYKDFLDDKEIKYPGKVVKAGHNTGNLRAQLFWNPRPDPSINKFVLT